MSYTLQYSIAPFQPGKGSSVPTVTATSVKCEGRPDPGAGTVTVSGTTVIVTKGEKPTVLYISIVDGTSAVYTPCGLAFSSPTGGQATSFTVSLQQASGNSAPQLSITDSNTSTGSWEFYVLFQDVSGNLGLLDPMITNS